MTEEEKQAKIQQLEKEIVESEKQYDRLWREKLISDAMKEDEWATTPPPEGFQILSTEVLRKLELPDTQFLVEKLIPRPGITILSGPPSAAKSWITMEIARCISSLEVDFLGKFKTELGRVLYIDEEGFLEETKRREKLLFGDEPSLMNYMVLQGFRIDNNEQNKKILKYVLQGKYSLVIFDALRSFYSGDENDSFISNKVMSFFKEFTRYNISCFIIHHNRKENFMISKEASQMLRGSSVWLASIDSLLAIEGNKKTDKLIEITMSQPKLRQGRNVQPFRFNLIENEGRIKFNWVGELQDDTTKLEHAKEIILNLLDDGKEQYQAELMSKLIALYFHERTVNQAFKELKDEKLVNIHKGEKNRTYLSKK
jgi:RecA-family ATPase